MSLLEIVGESFDPGDTGSCDMGGRERERRPPWMVLIYLAIAIAALGGWF